MIKISQIKAVTSPEQLKQLLHLYESAGWISYEDGQEDGLVNSIVSKTYCFAVAADEDRLIGMGRAISDGVSDAYIQDVTVLPEYRQRGIGGMIIDFLISTLKENKISWIGLISEPGYESFYTKLGFSVMPKYTPFIYTKE